MDFDDVRNCFQGGLGSKRMFALLAFAGMVGSVSIAASASRPNVIVIYADDLGYGDLGVTGSDRVSTPNIDSLSLNGVRFTNGYVTGCVCSPSRAGLLTGRYQQRFGFDANAEGRGRGDLSGRGLDLTQTTIAEIFRENGYTTGLVGKWHLGASKEYLPNDRGFDEFYGLLPHGIGKQDGDQGVPIYRNQEVVDAPDDLTVKFGNESEAFVDRHKHRPLLLYVAFTAVHAPHVVPESYLKRFHTSPTRSSAPILR